MAKAKEVTFNRNGNFVRKMIDIGIARETTDISNAVVAQMAAGWEACKVKQMAPAHADKVLLAINTAVAAKRGEDYDAKDLDSSRVSNVRTALKMYEKWTCIANGNLVKVLNTMDTITFEKLTVILQHMRGTPKVAAMWKPEHQNAPSAKALFAIMHATKKRKSKSAKRATSDLPVGMPGDIDRSLLHALKCAKAFDKKHGKRLAKGDRELVSKSIANLLALQPVVAKIVKADAKAEAEEAKKQK